MNFFNFKQLKRFLLLFIDDPSYIFDFLLILYYYKIKRKNINSLNLKEISKQETYDSFYNGNKKGIIRFGDGEFGLIYGFEINYQKYNKLLREELIAIIRNYSINSKYIIIFAPIFFQHNVTIPKNWIKSYVFLKLRLNKKLYYSSINFQEIGNNNQIQYIINLTKNKNLIYVGSMSKYKKQIPYLYEKKRYFIDCPIINAYDQYRIILNKILSLIKTEKLKSEEIIIFIALGPTAKILAYKLIKKGLLVLDIGKLFDRIAGYTKGKEIYLKYI